MDTNEIKQLVPGDGMDEVLAKVLGIPPRLDYWVVDGIDGGLIIDFKMRSEANAWIYDQTISHPDAFYVSRKIEIQEFEVYPNLSDSWNGMQQVVEKMIGLNWWPQVEMTGLNWYAFSFWHWKTNTYGERAHFQSAPHACGIAALLILNGGQSL